MDKIYVLLGDLTVLEFDYSDEEIQGPGQGCFDCCNGEEWEIYFLPKGKKDIEKNRTHIATVPISNVISIGFFPPFVDTSHRR